MSFSGWVVWVIIFGKRFDREMYFSNSPTAQSIAGIHSTHGVRPHVWLRWECLRISFSISPHQRNWFSSKKNLKRLAFLLYRYFSLRMQWSSRQISTFSFRHETIWIVEWMRPMDEYTINWNQSESHWHESKSHQFKMNACDFFFFLCFSFIMFSLLLCMLTITWILSIFSWFDSDGMFYMNLTISAIQAPLVLYICVLRQEHITYLLKKSCCSKQPLSAADWGDEMTYINTANR